MDSPWSIGIHDWILSDGNYADFEVGETRQFALEFHSDDFARSDSASKSAELIDRCTYRVNAVVAYINEDMWVLDFGIKAYDQRPGPLPPDFMLPEAGRKQEAFVSTLSVGQAVKCTLHLSIDHYLYMESLCSKPDMIPLIYTWQIDGICKQTGPRVLAQNVYIVDEAKARWHDVERTNTSLPEPTGANELLCRLVNPVPTAEGETLARWDESEEQRAIRTMQTKDLYQAIERYDRASTKLEQFVAATKTPGPPGETEMVFMPVDPEEVPRLKEQYAQYLESIDKSKMERLIQELELNETLEKLSLTPEWIVHDPRLAEQFLAHVTGLKEKALKRLSSDLQKQETTE